VRPVLLALLAGALACGGGSAKDAKAAADQAQAEAEELGREVADIVDRVMAYRSSHRGNLPASLRQAGIDSLTPRFERRLSRQGEDPLVTIAWRRLGGRQLVSCQGTNLVLEDQQLRGGNFDVSCHQVAGGTQVFTVPPPPPPEPRE
jgi:hypothetical protein